MQENADQDNSEYEYFLGSGIYGKLQILLCPNC